MENLHRFEGKTVIVTGSSSGIGEGIARRFHKEGAKVVINARSEEDCREVADSLGAERTLVVAGDISSPEFAKDIVARTVEAFGGLDVLCNNAGVAASGDLDEASEDDIGKVIDINVKGTTRFVTGVNLPVDGGVNASNGQPNFSVFN
ncbi:SDR family NAD(P)-dependent oxidoreductase [Parapontixanthobacter aurantiacus]|uniref:SDR family NAD(P)-dependent oxidoreductase n=1 Tax=Parapontixanthobacter aurantiacus TaxID=1463599 RepID=UPI00301B855D